MNPENFPSLINEEMTAREMLNAKSKLGGKTKNQAQSVKAGDSAREPKLLINDDVTN